MIYDHCYVKDNDGQHEEEHRDDVDYSDIFDSMGNWRKEHLRKLVHVLDAFRVSHEAYHELCMVSKGHLPPISRLAKERRLMSEEIPYSKYPNVCPLQVDQ